MPRLLFVWCLKVERAAGEQLRRRRRESRQQDMQAILLISSLVLLLLSSTGHGCVTRSGDNILIVDILSSLLLATNYRVKAALSCVEGDP